jgi:nucleotide-binding universal stress UspA family protein
MQRIVVGVDGSETSERALQWAVEEARLRHATITVVNAWSVTFGGGYPFAASAIDPAIFEEAGRQILDAAVRSVDATGVELETVLECGGAAESLIAAAKGADLVVVGSRGLGGFTGLLLGSVSHQVAHHAPCPVVIIPSADA